MNRPSWRIRRRVVVCTLVYCAAAIAWLIAVGPDTALNQSIANGLILLVGGVIGSYVFGATWDDLNVMKTMGPAAYEEPQAKKPDNTEEE